MGVAIGSDLRMLRFPDRDGIEPEYRGKCLAVTYVNSGPGDETVEVGDYELLGATREWALGKFRGKRRS